MHPAILLEGLLGDLLAGRGGRRPAIAEKLQALIRRMSTENALWGQKRIQAELARLGFKVSARTVASICAPGITGAQAPVGESS